MDAVKNFGIVEVSTGYNASDTSIALSASEGAKLPQPSTDGEFNLVWWNFTDYADPSDDPNKEIVRVTARSTDTLTVVRPVVGNDYNGETSDNTASTKNTASKTYKMQLAFTHKAFQDLASGWSPYSAVVPTRTAADDPTYTIQFAGIDVTSLMSVGMRVKLTQNSTTRYFIITSISFSTNTTITLFGGTDYDVDDTGTYTISDFCFSSQKAPYGFPLDVEKWTLEAKDTSDNSQSSPTAGTWYNLGTFSLAIHIGSWEVYYSAPIQGNKASSNVDLRMTLSTANNSASDGELTALTKPYGTASAADSLSNRKGITISSKTTYYLNYMTNTSGVNPLYAECGAQNALIRAVCAYL